MNLICNNCDKIFTKKYDYNNHINRKFPCKPVKKDIYVEDPKLHTTPHNSSTKPAKSSTKPAKSSIKFGSSITELEQPSIECQNKLTLHNNITYECPNCFKKLSSSDVLHRHIKKYCAVIKEETKRKDDNDKLIKELIEEMRELKRENKELKETIIKTTTNKVKKNTSNNNCNNTNTNINANVNSNNTIIHNHNTIVAFDTEDFGSILTDAECGKLLFRGRSAVLELLKHIHFNEKYPQFHNCYISNTRDFRGIIYDGNNWLLKKNDEIIDKLIEKNDEYLVDKFEELKDKLNPQIIKKFKTYLNRKEDPNDNKVNLLQYKDEIKEILYNERRMVEETRRKDTEMKKEIEKNKLLENQKVE
jgi:hypothetical protein